MDSPAMLLAIVGSGILASMICVAKDRSEQRRSQIQPMT
jgi:hypothetical protein